jgi:hypothetical protein
LATRSPSSAIDLAQAGGHRGRPHQLVGLGPDQAGDRDRRGGRAELGVGAEQAGDVDGVPVDRGLAGHAGVVAGARDPRQHPERAALEVAGDARWRIAAATMPRWTRIDGRVAGRLVEA